MSTAESDWEALDRFVAENDDLLAIEDRIGKFNIFSALRLERAEIRHSNFLAWLLDPAESHGQNDTFLKALVMDLLRQARKWKIETGVSAAQLDGEDIGSAKILREDGHTDILIEIDKPSSVICIENKMHGHERAEKLERYREHVNRKFPTHAKLFVFLNPDGLDGPSEGWISYSFRDVHDVLRRMRDQRMKTLGSDVALFLDHYLDLLESRFMSDQKIQELCRRIYRNHRRAIDLINEHGNMSSSPGLTVLLDVLRDADADWVVCSSSSRYLRFVPKSWVGVVCDHDGARLEASPCDVTLTAESWSNDEFANVSVRLVVGDTDDQGKRLKVIEQLMGGAISMKKKGSGSVSEKWTRLNSKTLAKWAVDEEVPTQKLGEGFREWLVSLKPQFGAIREVLMSVQRA